MRVVRVNAKTTGCCRYFSVASFQHHATETDELPLYGAKIAWRYSRRAGFQWEVCDLSRYRFNVREGLDLLDKKTPHFSHATNALKFLPELLLHQLNYHVQDLDSSAPQGTKYPIKKKEKR